MLREWDYKTIKVESWRPLDATTAESFEPHLAKFNTENLGLNMDTACLVLEVAVIIGINDLTF